MPPLAFDPAKKPAPEGRGHLVAAFWGAVLISVGLSFVPSGRYALYPFALLSTWAHEMGHGLTTLVVGGSFDHLELYSNLGGVAFSRGASGAISGPLVSAGGLLGPAILGGLIVVLGAHKAVARRVLLVLSFLLVVSLVLWVRNLFGAVGVAGLAAGLGAIAWFAPEGVRLVVTQLCGIQLCLGSLSSFDYMFTKQFERDGKVMISDTQAIAEHLLLPYWVWGAIIAALSLLILLVAFYVAWVRPFAREKVPAGA
jgi:hypothetical protein